MWTPYVFTGSLSTSALASGSQNPGDASHTAAVGTVAGALPFQKMTSWQLKLFPGTEDSKQVRKFFSVYEGPLIHPEEHNLGILVLQVHL